MHKKHYFYGGVIMSSSNLLAALLVLSALFGFAANVLAEATITDKPLLLKKQTLISFLSLFPVLFLRMLKKRFLIIIRLHNGKIKKQGGTGR
jgi:hypothetical protein